MAVLYICNRQKCRNCHSECRHTTDVRYAADFEKADFVKSNEDVYIQREPGHAKYGKWVPKMIQIAGIDWPSGMKCSECGNDALNAEGYEFLTDYCPNCGARMVEE